MLLAALFVVFSACGEDGVNMLVTDDIVEIRFPRTFRFRSAESYIQMFAYSSQRRLLHGLAAASHNVARIDSHHQMIRGVVKTSIRRTEHHEEARTR